MRNLVGILGLVFSIILLVWIGSLFFVNRLYSETTGKDAPLMRDYLVQGYKATGNWDFMSDLWTARPSLQEVRLERAGGGEALFLAYRRGVPRQVTFTQTAVENFSLGEGERVRLTLIYHTLPREEVIYYSAIALAMLLSSLLLFFFFFWRLA